MFPSPLLFGAAFSGLLGTVVAAPAEPEQCLTGSYVVFEVQPYEVICGGSTFTSSVTKTWTVPFDPTATGGDEPGKPSKPEPPNAVTVTKPCAGENCSPGTYSPEPGCTKCVVTVITRTTVIESTQTPAATPTPDVTPTITIGCPDPDNCKPTTLYPPPGCTRTCTVTIITPPAESGNPPATITSSGTPGGPPPSTVTTTIGCPDRDNCTPGTYPPSSGCTRSCTATVITPPASSAPPTTAPPSTVTTTSLCTDFDNCTPGTFPPTSDCTTGTCTVIVVPSLSSSSSGPVTTAPPPSTVTTTVPCPDSDNCTPGTFPPASDCTTGTCTVTIVPTPSSLSSSASSTSELPSSTSDQSSSTSDIPSSTSSETSSTTTSETPGPTFSCDAGGYLIQNRTLYRLNLTTGATETVAPAVGNGLDINAIGYNILDNYIWGIYGNSQLIRINAAGDSTQFNIEGAGLGDGTWQTGDVDRNGILWVSSAGKAWARIDVNQDSPTFGQILERGTSDGAPTADWALIPQGGNYFYSVQHLSDTSSQLARWNRQTHQWEVLRQLGNLAGNNQWGALYSAGQGIMYGSENASGDIWKFNVLTDDPPERVTDGPISAYNDGARCILASDPDDTGAE